jgi:hypothetical protein
VTHRSALTARLRTVGGRVVRRLGLLPGGEPDSPGEDAALGNVVLPQRVVTFFPEPPRNSYQLEQWLGVLHALDERHGVVLINQDSRTTRRCGGAPISRSTAWPAPRPSTAW